jgi:hypothetical protein
MNIGQHVLDTTDADLGEGEIIDIYANPYCEQLPVTMLTVKFEPDQVFDRLPTEVSPVVTTKAA